MHLQVPGIYQLPAAEYHADRIAAEPTLSHSIANIIIDQSPLHAWTAHSRLNPAHEPEERKEFDLGSAAHAALFEGEAGIVVLPFDNYRKDAAQAMRDELRAAGKYPVLTAQYEDVMAMREAAIAAIAGCRDLSGLTLATGRAEHVLVWREGPVICRARLDFLFAGEQVFLDYKTTTDATPGVFTRQMVRMGYHRQDDFYGRGVRAIFGKPAKGIFMAQEKKKPYACSFHGCGPSVREMAKRDNDHAIGAWEECLRTGVWPTHSNRIHWAEAKPWELEDQETRLTGNPYDPSQLFERRPREDDLVFPE